MVECDDVLKTCSWWSCGLMEVRVWNGHQVVLYLMHHCIVNIFFLLVWRDFQVICSSMLIMLEVLWYLSVAKGVSFLKSISIKCVRSLLFESQTLLVFSTSGQTNDLYAFSFTCVNLMFIFFFWRITWPCGPLLECSGALLISTRFISIHGLFQQQRMVRFFIV